MDNREFDFGINGEDGGFDGSAQYTDEYCGCSVCAQCGYRFAAGDDVIKVNATGDVIHRDCFIDYADDNAQLLTKSVTLMN